MANPAIQDALIPVGHEQAATGWLDAWKPRRPLAGDQKDSGKYPMSREDALTKASIQANPPCLKSLVIVDVDDSDVQGLAELVGLPRESWAVRTRNPVGTGHIGYALANPVCLTDAARRRPINLLARIERGLIDVLGGDVNYSGTFTKNPFDPAPYQDTLWPETNEELGLDFPTYQLKDLAKALSDLGALPAYNDPRPRKASGVGRNVDLFDRTRRWAYQAVKRYWGDAPELWHQIVEDHATVLNKKFEQENREPLPTNEVHHLAKSIAKWVWQRFTPEQFTKIQTARGKKSGEKRSEFAQSFWRQA